jgi:hypothetical protein
MITIGNKDKAIAIGIKDPKTVARFMKKQILKDNGCVEYVGFKTSKGYGQFKTGTTGNWESVRAHRFSICSYIMALTSCLLEQTRRRTEKSSTISAKTRLVVIHYT